MKVRSYAMATALLMVLAQGGCSLSGPTTKDEVCSSFDSLGEQLLQGNGIFGNPLFHAAGALADVAVRFDGTPSLSQDAAALKKIAAASSTNASELMNATTTIAKLCGHPLGTNAILDR